ncbi:hypothetical protein CRYUN_Cryun17cG0144800 [Craigia yunnanensis]
METPSSTRRDTRSQTLAALNNSIPVSKGKNEESEKSVSKKRTRNGKQQQERSALIDITNDSPIAGLAMGTPSSAIAKQRKAKNMMMTPGSGEALLRGQVKSLLQKVEEEAELSKVSLESRPFLHLQGCVNSPMRLLAPTPANTPQVSNLSEDGGINNSGLGSIVMALPVVEEQLKISEVVGGIFDGMKQEVSLEPQKSLTTRSLLLDFSEKSESSDSSECHSVVTDQGVITGESSAWKEKPSPDDDNASIWSIQVVASTHDEDEETIEDMGDDYYKEEEDYDDGGFFDELCQGLSKISMKEMFTGKHTRFVYNSDHEIDQECADDYYEEEEEEDYDELCSKISMKEMFTGKHTRFVYNSDHEIDQECADDYYEEEEEEDYDELCGGLSKISMKEMFTVKHTRFVYNSDDEIDQECAETEDSDDVSLDIIRLKGLPTPKGKHLRFPLEEQ